MCTYYYVLCDFNCSLFRRFSIYVSNVHAQWFPIQYVDIMYVSVLLLLCMCVCVCFKERLEGTYQIVIHNYKLFSSIVQRRAKNRYYFYSKLEKNCSYCWIQEFFRVKQGFSDFLKQKSNFSWIFFIKQ